jgi:uncharacterized oligopeptide transporter (OPT) family protein
LFLDRGVHRGHAAAVSPSQRISVRSVISGFILAILLCAVNSYLTLSFGVIEEGPTIAALFFFAFFFLSKTAITSDEMVIVSTMGSAGGSLGFISNFFAAKTMATGVSYTLMEMAGFAIVTSLVGLLFTIPLRDLLILKEDLPWPGSKAVKTVIEALTTSTDKRQPYYLLATCVLAIAYVVLNDEDGFAVVPEGTPIALFGLAAYGAAVSWSPFAIGGAYLMGFRTCVGFLFGGIFLLVMAPRLPNSGAPHRYIWPGMGFLLATGLTSLALNWRVVVAAIRSLFDLKAAAGDDDPIMGPRGFKILAAVAIGAAILHGVFAMDLNIVLVLILIVIGGFIQNIIATRAAAQTAFNPARVMGVLLQGACAVAGGSSAAQNLTGAGYVAGSGAQAGVLTGDLVYGRWLKVPSRWQFWAQSATVIPCAIVAAWVFTQIAANKSLVLEGEGLPAPVAKMWAASALIFEGKSAMPPFATEAMLIAGAIGVVYVLLERSKKIQRWLPDSIGVGLGLVLPVSYDLAFFVGGVILYVVLGRWLKLRDITLTTIAVGCIVAEGIGGVLKSALSVAGVIPH